VAVVALMAGCSSWNSMNRTEKGTAIGATSGAVAGAAVGGPIGAAVGAGVGGVVGHEAEAPGARNAGPSRVAGDMDSNVVRSAQQALNSRGYPVAVDGKWGASTDNAVRQFQQAQGLPQTGGLDDRTLSALGVSERASANVDRSTTGTTGTPR
jgi:osmotically inducible lipoprotein OsmB